MADFRRGLGSMIDNLKDELLFTSKLKKDAEKEKSDIFIAIRGGYASFYYKGCSLFEYKRNRFSTHYKYALVSKNEMEYPYVSEEGLEKIKMETSFVDGYENIKTQAALFTSVEPEGVSKLYRYAPTGRNRDNRFFLIDIEAAFEKATANKGKRSNDMIDIVLYDNVEKRLLFCEAKHYSNSEIWAEEGSKPAVIKQLTKYNAQIEKNKNAILEEYAKAFTEYNLLFGTKLHRPEAVCEKCGLLIFGFDIYQKEKIKALLINDGSLDGHKHYRIGDVSTISIEQLYKALS